MRQLPALFLVVLSLGVSLPASAGDSLTASELRLVTKEAKDSPQSPVSRSSTSTTVPSVPRGSLRVPS